MTRPFPRHSPGFTLIELIVIIVMFGFLAAMLVPFIGSALTRSHEPVERLRKSLTINQCMAELIAECSEHADDKFECADVFIEKCKEKYGMLLTCIKFANGNEEYQQIDGHCIDDDIEEFNLLRVDMHNSNAPAQKVTYIFIREHSNND